MTLAPSWRFDAAAAYVDGLQAHGLSLEVREGRVLLPEGATESEIALAQLLKPELMRITLSDTHQLQEERAVILELEAGRPRE